MANLLFRRGSKTEFDRLENKREDTMYAVSGESSGTPFVDLYVGDVKCNQQGEKPIRSFMCIEDTFTVEHGRTGTLFSIPVANSGTHKISVSVTEANPLNETTSNLPISITIHADRYFNGKFVETIPIMAGMWGDNSTIRTLLMNSSLELPYSETTDEARIIVQYNTGGFAVTFHGNLTDKEGSFPVTYIDVLSFI